MKHWLFLAILAVSLAGVPARAQADEQVVESLRLELFDLYLGRSGDHDRQRLAATGKSPAEIESLLFDAYDGVAHCIAATAQSTAVEQDVPIDYVVELVDRRMCQLGNWRANFGFDTRVLHEKATGCLQRFAEDMRAAAATQLPPNRQAPD